MRPWWIHLLSGVFLQCHLQCLFTVSCYIIRRTLQSSRSITDLRVSGGHGSRIGTKTIPECSSHLYDRFDTSFVPFLLPCLQLNAPVQQCLPYELVRRVLWGWTSETKSLEQGARQRLFWDSFELWRSNGLDKTLYIGPTSTALYLNAFVNINGLHSSQVLQNRQSKSLLATEPPFQVVRPFLAQVWCHLVRQLRVYVESRQK